MIASSQNIGMFITIQPGDGVTGCGTIILPLSAIPLIGTLYILQRRARKEGYHWEGAWDTINKSIPLHQRLFRLFYVNLDIVGTLLLVAGLALLLVPLSLTATRRSDRRSDGSSIAMLVLGIVILGVFLVWDTKLAESPFVPFRMVRERTVVAACGLAMLYWMQYAISTPFFPSYLQVPGGFSPGHATRIDNTLRVVVQVAAIFAGVVMKYTKRTRPSVFFGVPITILGQGLMIYFVSQDGGSSNSDEASFVLAKVLIGIGFVFQGTGAQIAIQDLLPHEDMPVATAVYFASMNLGGAIGASVSGSIWNEYLPKKLVRYLPDEVKPQATAIFQSFVFAQRFPKGSPIRGAIDKSYRETQQLLVITATAVLAPMLIVMFFMKNVNLEKADKEREGKE
ncbi:major facilitator [Fusarium napiforme]|uniref:Major facilitator n=1 Tax=Fusarium napiforme TaxID=42672 RepID=A0A8H5JD43_9HYPO|nr:major facilitator [Fusarium napiforme]